MPLPPAVEDATRKSGACWVDLGEGSHLVWHAWHDGALWVLRSRAGGTEQQLPGNNPHAEVTVRSRTGEVFRWTGQATAIGVDAAAEAVAVLHDKRCNAPDGEAQPERWARECEVVSVRPD